MKKKVRNRLRLVGRRIKNAFRRAALISSFALITSCVNQEWEPKEIPLVPVCEGTLGCFEVDFNLLTSQEVIDVIKCPNDAVFYLSSHIQSVEDVDEFISFEDIHSLGAGVCRHATNVALTTLSDNGFEPMVARLLLYDKPGHVAFIFKDLDGTYGLIGINEKENRRGFESLDQIAKFYSLYFDSVELVLTISRIDLRYKDSAMAGFAVHRGETYQELALKRDELDDNIRKKELEKIMEDLRKYEFCPE